MPSDRDDEMALTATAPPSSLQPAQPAQPLGATLGRYRLERELGEGGMGVVHAAFDPDLERRVALKVLRTGDSSDARQRLLREARAMAKLSHPNVVVVHEVGSANGRDYVAMELVDGHNLAEWVRGERRDEDDIIAAFVAAGRGLAAAHAAGLVHRDFKPHNVLRSRDGRILVTDFGLARGVDIPLTEIALDTTMRPDAQRETSSLSGLTVTGSVLGTPAYMAPEAWLGKPVGPPADQFGFCVALWEALTGERPFKGDTIEELRKLVDRGAAALDIGKLPRRLRAPLTRGLDADPARRYPTMDALLVDLAPARRSRVPVVAGGIAIVLAIAVFVATRGTDHGLACPPPAIAWPDQPADTLVGGGHGELAKAIDRDITAWHSIRDSACALTTPNRGPELDCLDGVLARADAIRRAAATIAGPLESDVLIEELVDPVVCTRATPPRLRMTASPDVVAALGLLADGARDTRKLAARDAISFADKPGIDPCARPIALSAAIAALKIDDLPQQRTLVAQEATAAEQCSDDRVLADAVVESAPYHFEVPIIGPAGQDALRKAQAAVARIDQIDLVAEIEMLKARIARDRGHWQEAFDAANRAIDGFGARGDHRRQLAAALRSTYTHLLRAAADDPAVIQAAAAKWKPIAIADHASDDADEFERYDAGARFMLGDVAGAHAKLLGVWHPKHDDSLPSLAIDGIVVDRDGKPVADATVATADVLGVDSIGVVVPQFQGIDATLRTAKTDAAGKFAISDAFARGTLIAEHGDQRSRAASVGAHMRVVLEPTRRLQGKVMLGATPSTKVQITTRTAELHAERVVYFAPVQRDGTFTVERVPVSRLQIGVSVGETNRQSTEFQLVPASSTATLGIVLTLPTGGRSVYVIARSTVAAPLDNVQILLFPGKLVITSISDLFDHAAFTGLQYEFGERIDGDNALKSTLTKLQPGDLVAHFDRARAGELTACAVALPSDLGDPQTGNWLRKHRNELALQCSPMAPNDDVIVVDTPPQKRFD